ncbi:alpha/beta fold hydrolase [Pyxidicoccus fallax]|uniref:Alpha/beta fold hydrolase n=1 Tax=Pyxidicoccus fallax TaxID=394095 RepID=A0A848LAX4_9BACT|nr:alpha/beta fold hydrolase [Pyxidicoccus fallax]NMO15777.1 alpha/beta fold hydrolase [Pyxidicoccus fallax]NPC77315.1 alpha/beta fold hydrolase [Pyxidicoccus fallax]
MTTRNPSSPPDAVSRRQALATGGAVLGAALSACGTTGARAGGPSPSVPAADTKAFRYRTLDIRGLSIFVREAGDPTAPTLLLLHGFPSSSFMYRELMESLRDEFHVVAPDYPGFGHSSAPKRGEWPYTFDAIADVVEAVTERLGLKRYALYVQDYGSPVGFRLATRHPERITGLITQNGNAYEQGLTPLWAPIRALWADRNDAEAEKAVRGVFTREFRKMEHSTGIRDAGRVSPDDALLSQLLLERPGVVDVQLDLFYDYRTNVAAYPAWQAYLREHQPPVLAVWGRNDLAFAPEGALAFKQDVPGAEVHLLDSGHFALEDHGDVIAAHVRGFLRRLSRA